MNTSELMIGDWVKFKNSDLAHKVIAIAGKSIKVDKVHWYSANKFRPIPLTPEILENNGFGRYNLYDIKVQHQWVLWFDKLTRVSLWYRELNDDNRDGMMVRVESPLANLCIKVCYLHQLQHVLRLCEIEKEIVL